VTRRDRPDFSLSLLDLLACGLAATILFWLLSIAP